jgi:hypothetical protein
MSTEESWLLLLFLVNPVCLTLNTTEGSLHGIIDTKFMRYFLTMSMLLSMFLEVHLSACINTTIAALGKMGVPGTMLLQLWCSNEEVNKLLN